MLIQVLVKEDRSIALLKEGENELLVTSSPCRRERLIRSSLLSVKEAYLSD
jgi:hypothetical protein